MEEDMVVVVVMEDPEACQEVTEVVQDKHPHLGDKMVATVVDLAAATMAATAVHPVAVPATAALATVAAAAVVPGVAIKAKMLIPGIKEAAAATVATSVAMVAAEAGAAQPEMTIPVVAAAAGVTTPAGTTIMEAAPEVTEAALVAAATMVTKEVTAQDLAEAKVHPWVVDLEAVPCVPIMAAVAATDLRLIR